jgi:hypothetical protein
MAVAANNGIDGALKGGGFDVVKLDDKDASHLF